MKALITVLCSLILFSSCGSTSGSDGMNIDQIRARLDKNACRIRREELVYRIDELEFINDTTYSVLPAELLPDSLLACPVTGEFFSMAADGGDRLIQCPSGHGETEI